MPEQILVTVDPQGNSQVEARGVPGPGCQHLTAAIERALGRTVENRTTPEYHQQATQPQAQRRQQGDMA